MYGAEIRKFDNHSKRGTIQNVQIKKNLSHMHFLVH